MTVSAVRALFAVANRPEVVSLAGGMPNIADLPLAELGDSFNQLVRGNGIQAMQYGSGQGELFMREKICEVMAEEAILANPDDVVITCGSQQALDLVTRIFINPGDVILCEAPSYVGAMGTFNAYQARINHVAMDEHGLVPRALAEACHPVRLARTPRRQEHQDIHRAPQSRLVGCHPGKPPWQPGRDSPAQDFRKRAC